jgi:NADH-quinone oxidoreductase subunit N
LLLAATAGAILLASAADFLLLFLGLETLSLALYVLCNYVKRSPEANESAIKYFLMGSLAAAFLLYGIALVYGALGTTNVAIFHRGYEYLTTPTAHALFLGGVALITLGIAFKVALVPFHSWAPDVYAGASTPVTALMAVTTKVGAFAAFIRLFMPAETAFAPVWSQGVALLAYPTLIYASFVATRQTQLRRFFAYSGIAHAGFMLLALAVNTPEAVQAMLFYLVIYGVATLGCFAVMALFDGEGEGEGMTLNSLKGLFRSSPWLAAVLAICLLTLAGIPPTVGFYAKFYLLKLAFQAGYYGLVTVALLSTILAAYFYLRLIAAMAGPIPVDSRPPQPSWPATTVAACAFGGLILLAINPQLILALL